MSITAFPNREDRYGNTSTDELRKLQKEAERVIWNLTHQIAWEHERRDKIRAEISLREAEAEAQAGGQA
jgi:hypothetical protein